MSEPNVARLIRENAVLREVASKAARLRRLGMACETLEETMEKVWRDAPDMTHSYTGAVMAETAYQTAMADFDRSLANAAETFARDPFAEDIALVPADASRPPASGEG